MLRHSSIATPLLVAMCLLAPHTRAGATEDSEMSQAIEPVSAIWKAHRVEFVFRSSGIYYSCDALREKIARIMIAVGAHENVNVDVHCRQGSLTNGAHTLITAALPVAATPEAVAEATTYSSETQLVARLQKVQLPTANDLPRFQAERRTVKLDQQRRVNLNGGDCDLLRGLSDQVFPKLSMQVTKKRLSCGLSNKLKPTLHVTALVPVPVEAVAYSPTSGNTKN